MLKWGSIAFMIVSLSACRFGNRVEEAPDESGDPITGYYETVPQSLLFCVSFSTEEIGTRCQALTTNLVPTLISSILSNPVALQLMDESSGESYLFDPNGDGSALPVYADTEALTLYYLGSSAEETVWEDTSCTSRLFIESSGTITKAETVTTNSDGVPISGRVALGIQVYSQFEGECDATFASLSACYADATACGESSEADNEELQGLVQELYNPYIEAGVLSFEEIPLVTALGYEVTYE